jgi:hypothetical protein
MHSLAESNDQNPVDLILVEDELVVVSEEADLIVIDLHSAHGLLSIDVNIVVDISLTVLDYLPMLILINIMRVSVYCRGLIIFIFFFKNRVGVGMLQTELAILLISGYSVNFRLPMVFLQEIYVHLIEVSVFLLQLLRVSSVH